MNISEALTKQVAQFRSEVDFVHTFAKSADSFLKERRPKFEGHDLDDGARAEVAEVVEKIRDAFDSEHRPESVKIDLLNESAANLIFELITPIKHSGMLGEMVVVYLLAKYEAFLKNYFLVVFEARPDILKSGRKVTVEEVLSHASFNEVVSWLASAEVDAMGYRSVDEMAEYLKKKFNVDACEYGSWGIVREATYRRNLIVHNEGKLNHRYQSKMEEDSATIDQPINYQYVEKLVVALCGMGEFIHKHIELKVVRGET